MLSMGHKHYSWKMKQDFKKILNTKNKLWLSWKKIIHEGNGNISLVEPKFTGPVLADCEPIEESGTIKLDLTHQYMLHIPRPYLIELTWFNKVHQDRQEALFKAGKLKDGSLGKLSLLQNRDSIMLDCTNHRTEDEKRGIILFNFYAIAFNSNKEPYNFNK